jgi:hypothetical protein
MYEARGNAHELWGVSCPHCGGTTSGIPRETHERLVQAAETRGSAVNDAVITKLSYEIDGLESQLAQANRRIAALSLAARASLILMALERLWRRMFTRRLKP